MSLLLFFLVCFFLVVWVFCFVFILDFLVLFCFLFCFYFIFGSGFMVFFLLVWQNSLASVKEATVAGEYLCCPCSEEQGGSTLLLHVSIPHGKRTDRRYSMDHIERPSQKRPLLVYLYHIK